MESLAVKPREACGFDMVALGEVMLRLDPGETRTRTARQFTAWAGGGEYNVARGLRRCFGLRTAVVTALADNDVGRLIEDCILQGGVDTGYLTWVPYDGIGRRVRNGLNFTERGFGARGALGVSDRGHSAASQMKVGDVDWDHLFGEVGVRWFHTGGICAGLSGSMAELVAEALQAAKRHGTVTSFDLNYRPSQWAAIGGHAKAQEVSRHLAGLVDVLVGNEEDFTACLGFEVPGVDEKFASLDGAGYEKMVGQVIEAYPNVRVVGTTLREVRSASVNNWSAMIWADGTFYRSARRDGLEIFDRVGGGDSFMSGLAYGLMEKGDPQLAVEFGAAHGALAMTTPGDSSMASLDEVERLVKGAGARVQR
jgi:2-dehydro-3-deoxygluconokinase